jgi:NAD dependent epimerase/dehydratase family enzyme
MTAAESGARVVCLRFGAVLSREGGILQRFVPFYRAGFGCALGTGRQWLSWIGLEDAVGAIRFALGEAGLSGPVNVVSPHLGHERGLHAGPRADLRAPAADGGPAHRASR